MKKSLFVLLSYLLLTFSINAQDARELIQAVNSKFSSVQDYNADIHMKFALPGIKIKDIKGKVFFKKADRFKIRAKGIFFIPKDNPMKNIPKLLADTETYTAVISGYAEVEGKKCAVVNVIPLNPEQEVIIGKFWISVQQPLVYISEITTKKNGTIRTKSFYGANSKQALPNKMLVQVEMKKFKIPKMLAMDVKNSGSKISDERKKGEIYMVLHNYKINTRFSDEVFSAK